MDAQHSLLLPNLEKAVKDALETWTRVNKTDANPLGFLYVVKKGTENEDIRSATNLILEEGLQILGRRAKRQAELLRMRFQNHAKAYIVARKLDLAESSIYRLQNTAIEELAKIILQLEIDALKGRQTSLIERLEAPTYSNLVNAEKSIATLSSLLRSDDFPWIISIEGIGGIGKTALADALIRHVIQQSSRQEIGWVTSRQKVLNLGGELITKEQADSSVDDLITKLVDQLWGNSSGRPSSPLEAIQALEYRLQSTPHIIVIDNLETVSEVKDLLPLLRRLSNPSKFLVTSRESSYSEADIFHFPVPALSEKDSILLVRREAQSRNLSVLTNFSDAELMPIFETVGGNPLALRLVVGQVHFRPLQVVLSDLLEARGQKAENLYMYVFQAAWENLDSLSQDVLLAMPFVPPLGETQDILVEVTGLSTEEVMEGLDRLIVQNLVDCRREKNEYRYSIHSLTRSFLQTEAIKWKTE